MAQITITIPDDKVSRVFNAFDKKYMYEGDGTPADKLAFVRKHLVDYIKRIVRGSEVDAIRRQLIDDYSEIELESEPEA